MYIRQAGNRDPIDRGGGNHQPEKYVRRRQEERSGREVERVKSLQAKRGEERGRCLDPRHRGGKRRYLGGLGHTKRRGMRLPQCEP